MFTGSRTIRTGLNLQGGRFRLDIRKDFLTLRTIKLWNRLPMEAFKDRLDQHHSGWARFTWSCLRAGGWARGPIPPSISEILRGELLGLEGR